MALALGETLTDAMRRAVDNRFTYKEYTVLTHLLVNDPELHRIVFFLQPLYKAALIVLVRLCNLLNVTQTGEDPVKQKATALLVPLVDIYSTDKRLERIAIDIAVVLLMYTA